MRLLRFGAVGAAGIVVQIAVLAALVHGAGAHYLPASIVAVGCALVHNYAWHVRWTWADRRPAGDGHLGGFARFTLVNGLVSLAGTLGLMPMLVERAGVAPVLASCVAIVLLGLANFGLAGRMVFRDSIGSYATEKT